MWETWVQSLDEDYPLEKGMATHSNILAGRIPMDRGAWWATVPGVGPKELDTTEQQSTAAHRSVVTVLMLRARKLRLHPYP